MHACVLGTFFQAPSLLSRAGFAVPYSGLEANPYDTLGARRHLETIARLRHLLPMTYSVLSLS